LETDAITHRFSVFTHERCTEVNFGKKHTLLYSSCVGIKLKNKLLLSLHTGAYPAM